MASKSPKRTPKAKIKKLLSRALLKDGEMAFGLFEYELEEYLEDWYKGLIKHKEDFLFVVTENSGDVAMVLIMADKNVYINEKARDQLRHLWSTAYESNIKMLMPKMAQELANDTLPINGVSLSQNDARIVLP